MLASEAAVAWLKQAAKEVLAASVAKAAKPQEFEAGALGQGKKNGGGQKEVLKRRDFLDRLRFLYPLPSKVEAYWEEFRVWFPVWIAKQHGPSVGSLLVDKAKEWKASPEGQSLFATWVKKQWALKPKEASTVAL